MSRKKQTLLVRQDVVKNNVQAVSFDLVLKFTDAALQPTLYMDELVKTILEGLIDQYGEIIVKINWWTEGLIVIAPNKLPDQDFLNAAVSSQEPF